MREPGFGSHSAAVGVSIKDTHLLLVAFGSREEGQQTTY